MKEGWKAGHRCGREWIVRVVYRRWMEGEGVLEGLHA